MKRLLVGVFVLAVAVAPVLIGYALGGAAGATLGAALYLAPLFAFIAYAAGDQALDAWTYWKAHR